MKTSLFVNFSSEPFTGAYNGKTKTFAPGQSLYMPDYLAAHFAKHLTNRELIKRGKETATSPKFPEQVPDFMELFNQACIPDKDEDLSPGEDKDSIDTLINVANKNRAKLPQGAQHMEGKPDQVVDMPVEDDEEEFGEKPKELS
mgnify:CR=1 FL=1